MTSHNRLRDIDKTLLFAIYTPIFPILLFMIGWWGSLPFFDEGHIVLNSIIGLSIGIVISSFTWNKIQKIGFDTSNRIMAAIYIFYSIGTFGLFMGIPVFNVLLGVYAGLYSVRKSFNKKVTKSIAIKSVKNTAVFCTSIMLVVCVISAYIALSDSYTGVNLQGMLGLGFEVSRPTIIILIIVGGILLLAAQYSITYLTGIKTIEFYSKSSKHPAKK